MALSRFATRMRRPRLRVVSHTLPTPRRLMPWAFGDPNYQTRILVEHWTEAEWALLAEAEKPENAAFLPGAGWILVERPEWREFQDAKDAYASALASIE